MNGKITASSLNVRHKPKGNLLGALPQGTIVEILGEEYGWYKINFNDSSAYVSGKYVEKIKSKYPFKAKITTILNIRKESNSKSNIVGSYQKDEIVEILDKTDNWFHVQYNGEDAFIYSKYALEINADGSTTTNVVSETKTASKSTSKSTTKHLYQNPTLQEIDLEPAEKLALPSSSKGKMVAGIYNKYGGLMKELSQIIGIDLATAIAVFSVESGGNGFYGDKMIIRFETHLFHRYWGKNNEEEFKKHFKFSSTKGWQGHEFSEDGENWISYHGKQSKEWQVLEYARKLDNVLALKSISMGAPQIMGSNYKMIGYDGIPEMFENFNKGIRFHIFGFFDFLDKRMLKALIEYDFVTFAKYYNGRGQAQRYGEKIKEYFDAFPK